MRELTLNEYTKLVLNINKLNKYCFICGETEDVTAHHIRKSIQGHQDYTDLDNIVILCRHHHKDYHKQYTEVNPKTFAEYVKHEKEKESRKIYNENKILKNELKKLKNKKANKECDEMSETNNIYNELIDAFAEHEYIIQKIKSDIKNIIQEDKSYTIISNPSQKTQDIDVEVDNDVVRVFVKPSISNQTVALIDDYLGFQGVIEAVNRNGKKLWLSITYEKKE